MMLIRQRREGVGVGFGIEWQREGHEGVERSAFVRCERETIVNRGLNVAEDLEGGVPVAFGWFIVVPRQKGVALSEVWSRALSKPPNQTNHTLIFLSPFQEREAVIGLVRFGTEFDG